jgi:formylglycine-generating enzyme required for sulfatase activity
MFDPDSPRWQAAGAWAVGPLLGAVEADPLHLGAWAGALRPVRTRLTGPLHQAFAGSGRADRRRLAAGILQDYAADDPPLLADLLADADAPQFALLLPRLEARREQVLPLLRKELDRAPAPDAPEPEKEAVARRRANAAAGLLRLGEPESAWPVLRHTPDPTARSYLLQRLPGLHVEARLLGERLGAEPDVSARRALILGLGEYAAGQLPADVQRRVTGRLLAWYRDDPDPGIHGAIDWLLRHAREGPDPRPLDWNQTAALARIDAELAGQAPGPGQWYVDRRGDTWVTLTAGEFLMGSPAAEPGRGPNELLHRRRIGRTFAIASKPVTVRQWQAFRKAHGYYQEQSPEPDCPINCVTWYDAAAYCRWLSEQDPGIPEKDYVYPPVADIEKAKQQGTPLKLPADYLARTGYRLPTEAEWEYACRAGAVTAYCYSGPVELLPRYAWYLANAEADIPRSWPVGQKRPNDFGLFDVHGNVFNWCQEGEGAYQPGSGSTTEDREDARDVTAQLRRGLHGGSHNHRSRALRSANRSGIFPAYGIGTVGLRPARTCR